MLIVTTNRIPGKEFEVLGLVQGSTIQSINIGKDIGSLFKNIVGGELQNYNKMQTDARKISIDRMTEEAKALGADAVVGFRLNSSAVVEGGAEVLAYGTAVKYI